jgi:RNA polymerase sigma-70 factor (ECF subfamily)
MATEPDPEETFVQLVVSHQGALRAFVLSLLPGFPEVDDVIQEANAEIWKKRGDFRIGTNFKSWMFSVAKFKVMSSWRDRQRCKEWAMPEDTLVKLIERLQTDGVIGDSAKREALQQCLRTLQPADRGLILRRYIGDFSLAELGKEVGRGTGSLKVSLHRIRVVLRTCIRRRIRLEEVRS